MAILTREEFLNRLNSAIGDDTSDESLTLIEDMTETFDHLSGSNNGENWKQKYEENDASWRKKYRDRFFSSPVDEPDNKQVNKPKAYTYENLFKEGE